MMIYLKSFLFLLLLSQAVFVFGQTEEDVTFEEEPVLTEEETVVIEEPVPIEETVPVQPKEEPKINEPTADDEVVTKGNRYDENLYMRGDLNAQVKLGAGFPLFINSFGFKEVAKFQVKPGILLGVGIDAYLSNNVKLGGELSFFTSTGVNAGRIFFVPIVFRAFYEFHIYSWSFPVGAGVGVNIMSYKGKQTSISPVLKPEVGANYNITRQWAVGLNVAWPITGQFVWKDLSKSRVGNVLEVTVAAQYHF